MLYLLGSYTSLEFSVYNFLFILINANIFQLTD